MSLRLVATTLVALSIVFSPSWLAAQTSLGTVNGTIEDSAGLVVPGATVTLTNQATNITTVQVTNNNGFFTFVNIRPGSYALTVEVSGFKTARVGPFTVGVSETLTRNLALELGDLSEVVVVTAQSELLQTSTAELGTIIEEEVIANVPIQGRNFTNLMLLTPGANPVSTAQGAQVSVGFGATEGNTGIAGAQIANASLHGQQNRSKIYYMDGIINTSVRGGSYVAVPDLDAVQEFKVQTHSDKAEFGGVMGGVVNMTTKSGGNRYRGGAWGSFRNENFVARNPFRDAGRDKPPIFRQGQYGGHIGGPLKRNRTFYFVSYEGFRYRDLANEIRTVPAAGELDGDFSQSFHGRTIYNPYTTRVENGVLVRDPFPNNRIPQELISPTVQAILKAYMVRPNRSGNVEDNFFQNRPRTQEGNAIQGRIDHHFSSGDNIFFRWTEQRISAFDPFGDRGFRTPETTNRNFGGAWYHSFSPSVVMEVRGGVATQPTEAANAEHELGNEPLRGLGLPEFDRFQHYTVGGLGPWDLPTIGVTGFAARGNPNWNAAADVSWLRGNHSFKSGFQMLGIAREQRGQSGGLSFSQEVTRNPQRPSTTGDGLASALLGIPARIQGSVPDIGAMEFRTSTLSAYVQDQWSLRPNLTLTYGLRYDYIGKVIGKEGLLQSGPDMKTGEWLLALPQLPPVCDPGGGTRPPCLPSPIEKVPFNEFIRATGEEFSMLKPIKDNFGPRVGLAWAATDRTVVRSGYSLMWDSMVSRSQYGQHQFENWGWPQFSGIDTGDINKEGQPIQKLEEVESLPFALPRAQPWNGSGWFNDPDRKNAYSHQWNVEIQREMGRNMMLGVAYVGSYNGRMEYAGYAQVAQRAAIHPDGRRMLPAERDQLRRWPHIQGSFRYSDSTGMMRYNALQFRMQRRFSDGLGTLLNYTFSRTIDTSSGWFNTENGVGGRSSVQNFYDQDNARGLAGYDVPHILTWATVWELPVGRGKRLISDGGVASAILGNWQLNWFLVARTGQPFMPEVGGDPANIGITNYSRPDLVGSPIPSNQGANMWFDRAAFAVPVNDFGNLERNSLRLPNYWTVDLSIQRNIPVGNNRLEVKLELFNAFNNINLGNPTLLITNPNAGRINSMRGDPRQAQLGLRLTF